MIKWLIWVPVVVLAALWWMRRSKNTRNRADH